MNIRTVLRSSTVRIIDSRYILWALEWNMFTNFHAMPEYWSHFPSLLIHRNARASCTLGTLTLYLENEMAYHMALASYAFHILNGGGRTFNLCAMHIFKHMCALRVYRCLSTSIDKSYTTDTDTHFSTVHLIDYILVRILLLRFAVTHSESLRRHE